MNNSEIFEPVRKHTIKEVFKTRFNDENLVEEVARFEITELNRVLRCASNVTIPNVDEMERYLLTLLELRCKAANEERLGDYVNIVKRVRVPARWYTILLNVGQALDRTRNFQFVPEFKIEYKMMTVQELKDMSELLEEYYPDGYTTVPGLPRAIDGSLHFMAKTMINDVVMGADVENPVYAFLSAVLRAEVISDTYEDLSLMFRVKYSSFETYTDSFREYFRIVQETNEQKSPPAPPRAQEPRSKETIVEA